ncbi:MAG: hypothetical protein IT435_18345 [Phycisphaerales bacterium]|nr:hypothetical protein [Phycisphaerales bacterium]
MKSPKNDSAFTGTALACAGAMMLSSACAGQPVAEEPARSTVARIAGDPEIKRPPFAWGDDDSRLLDEVQRGAFNFFWDEALPGSGCVPDRTGVGFASIAGIGFQLASLPIGVERGWVNREKAAARARLILTTLSSRPGNRKEGMFYHYLDGKTGEPAREGYEEVASTIDSALLFAGMVVASSYFGDDIATLADGMLAGANWAFYVAPEGSEEQYRGFISLGWKDGKDGGGGLLPFYWVDAGDEQRLVTFLAVCSPEASYRVEASSYYRLRRRLGEYGDGPMVWFPWSGALFTSFFAHCWIDYAHIGEDDPAGRGVERRVAVDWWENSRRTVLMHRRKAIENPRGLAGFGEDAWGLSACDGEKGYLVPGLFPRPIEMEGSRPDLDITTYLPEDEWGDGTIAPYAAGSAIMFTPKESMAALRHYRGLMGSDGKPLVWRDPGSAGGGGGGGRGGHGFVDSYTAGTGWRAPGCVAIDQGPLLLAIENARTGLVLELFHRHRFVRGGMERLGLKRSMK